MQASGRSQAGRVSWRGHPTCDLQTGRSPSPQLLGAEEHRPPQGQCGAPAARSGVLPRAWHWVNSGVKGRSRAAGNKRAAGRACLFWKLAVLTLLQVPCVATGGGGAVRAQGARTG